VPTNPPGALAVVWGLPTRLTQWVTLPVNLARRASPADSFDGSEVLTIKSVLIEWKVEVRHEDDD